MKKLVLVLSLIMLATVTVNAAMSNVNKDEKTKLKSIEMPQTHLQPEKVEPTVCRYYAIIAATDFGDYASQSWQAAYTVLYNDCMGR